MALWAGAWHPPTLSWVPLSFVLSLLVATILRYLHAMYVATQTALFLSAAAERVLVRDVKEKLRYIGAGYDTVHKSTAEMNKEKTCEPPDENFITIGAEHFRSVQCVLFHCHISLDYDTQLQSTAKIDKEETHERPDVNISTVGAERYRCVEVLLLPFRRIHNTSLQSNELPDGNINIYCAERFRCVDILFQPSFIGKEATLPTKCYVDTRKKLCAMSCCHMARPCSKGFLRA